MAETIKMTREDFGTICICALRYCQGRQTYMPDLVTRICKAKLKVFSDKDINVMLDDCDFQEKMNNYGDPRIDKPVWIAWKEALMEEKRRREACE